MNFTVRFCDSILLMQLFSVVNNCTGSKLEITTIEERKIYKSISKIQRINQESWFVR